MFTVAFIIGDAAWLAYGVIYSLIPIIFWNILALLLAGMLLFGENQIRENRRCR